MKSSTMIGPSTAERVRSACRHAETATLALPAVEPVEVVVHHLRQCGDVVLAVRDDVVIADGTSAVVELTDHAPLPLREPVRALVWLRGQVRTVPVEAQRALAVEVAKEFAHPMLLDIGHGLTLVRVRVASAVLANATGAELADEVELRAASIDPFADWEDSWLQHLADDHADIVAQLSRHLPARLRGGVVKPLAIDQYGITLRVEHVTGDHDLRLPFSAPACDIESLSMQVRILAGCPFRNGLRNR
nr:DUF2470 domain-containing protein [Nocardia camponoti]